MPIILIYSVLFQHEFHKKEVTAHAVVISNVIHDLSMIEVVVEYGYVLLLLGLLLLLLLSLLSLFTVSIVLHCCTMITTNSTDGAICGL